MKRIVLIATLVGLWLQGVAAAALERTSPEAEGVPSGVVAALIDSLMALPDTEIHSVMVLRHGKVIGEAYPEPFGSEYRHTMYSCSKTFVAVGVGLAIADNRLRLTDRVATFFPEAMPAEVSPELAAITVRDLLTMTAGIVPDWTLRNHTDAWLATYLGKPVQKPGEVFRYDSMCSYVLSAIVTKVTGKRLLDYLQEKLLAAMGIDDACWEVSPEGYNTGGWGLHIKPESLAKMGVLLSHGGEWEGRQLIPAEWVREMTRSQVAVAPCDYGYQTWRCEHPTAFRADGALGQYILVEPVKDVVVVITECTLGNGRKQRELVWRLLLPAVQDEPLEAVAATKPATYCLAMPAGKAGSPMMAEGDTLGIVTGENPLGIAGITLTQRRGEMTALLRYADGSSAALALGHRKWLKAGTKVPPPYSIAPRGRFNGIDPHFVVAGSYAWKSRKALRLKLEYVNWVSAVELEIAFGKDGVVSITGRENYKREPWKFQGKIM